eukprot:m.11622 g.11622  ORF g.11622 m.11622 type:complete len:681 (-) comp5834_c0_seq1:31-2073(-)
MAAEWTRLFVPGRVCLFGEHSDWAGGFRRFNSAIPVGQTIVVGTNQGLHAKVRKHSNKLIITSTTSDGDRHGPFSVPMRKKDLLRAAREGGFFSYAAGVAYKLMIDHQVAGLEIDNFETDLPHGKGLSSSAAVCVLVARAFSVLYHLKMTVRGEMEYAYQGEILTPSKCGRMDQGCAYGSRPILMTYDGEFLDVEELQLSGPPLHYVLVDLRGTKSTTEILRGLQEGFPTPTTATHHGVHELLGQINLDIAKKACEAFRAGDAARLGALMTEAQAHFDRLACPACPSQLTMPLLHTLLALPSIQPLIFGGKGVGSQGDGTAQLLCRDATSQAAVIAAIEKELGMPCLQLTLTSGPQVRNALITAAGAGAGNFPASKAVKPELFPIIDVDGRAKPVVLVHVEALLAAGITDVHIVVQPEDLPSFERLFKKPVAAANLARLPAPLQEYERSLMDLADHVHFIVQDRQEGFGDAVWCARHALQGQPFVLVLGEHLYSSTAPSGLSCLRQVLAAYQISRQNVLGLQRTPLDHVSRFGTVTGVWRRNAPNDSGPNPEDLLDISRIVEKPTRDQASEQLVTDGLGAGEFLTMFGIYVLSPKVFDILGAHIAGNLRVNGMFQLTPALDQLRKDEGLLGCVVKGQRFDIRDPSSYLQALREYPQAGCALLNVPLSNAPPSSPRRASDS